MAMLANYQPILRGPRRPGLLRLLLLGLLASCQPAWSAPHLPAPASSHAMEVVVHRPGYSSSAWTAAPAPSTRAEPRQAAPLELLEVAVAADPLASAEQREWFGALARKRLAEAQGEGAGLHEPELAQKAFAFVHERILVGRYEPSCARLHVTLTDGTFNCLTATYWYLALCRDAGLQARAIAAPNHVAVRLWIDGDMWDVETTDPRWNPRQSSRTGGEGVRELSDGELLARVHYNLGIEFAEAGRFELALLATRRSCQLDPAHRDARANLLATINNWSLTLVDRGEYERAEALLREGLAFEPTSAALRRSDAYLRQQRRAPSR